ncbi:MAG: class I SAM-dependent methyltransferase [Nitrospirae bacterium]|nr:class I SAM-dependent methyltransferase [Nitrospirota bacterium]
MNINYTNYFKDHYGAKFQDSDFLTQEKFLYAQFQFMLRKCHMSHLKDSKVLEIGSGLGTFGKILLDSGFSRYTGIELDKDIVEFTNRAIGEYFVNISVGEFVRETEDKYKIIFALEVLEHLENPIKEIENIYYLLESGGVFVGTTPYPFEKNIQDNTHLFVLHPNNWKRLFYLAGFKRVSSYPMSFLPYIWRLNKHLNIRIPFYTSFKHFISTSLIIAEK